MRLAEVYVHDIVANIILHMHSTPIRQKKGIALVSINLAIV